MPPVTVEARNDNTDSIARPADASALAEALDTTYYAARQLDVYPALAAPLDLDAAGKAAAAGIAGRALVLVSIDASGVVNDVSVVEAEPARIFEDARRAFMSARFTPAYRNGRPVRSRVLVQIDYGGQRAAKE